MIPAPEIHLPLSAQTRWRVAMLNTRTSDDICEFNPTLTEHEGQRFLITRRAKLIGSNKWTNSIVSWRLSDDWKLSKPRTVAMREPLQQHEDPRAFLFRGEWHIGCANYIDTRTWPVHQSIHRIEFDGESWSETIRTDVEYRGNGDGIKTGTRHEKNWTFFDDFGRLKGIYQMAGHHEVFDCDTLEVHRTPAPSWAFGELRGGSNPVKIGGEFWAFFHSSTPWVQPQRRYFMGVYAFEATPPYRITRISRRPILSGSQAMPRRFRGPLVVFPCGALLRDDIWTVSFGINDEECGLIEIPHTELESSL